MGETAPEKKEAIVGQVSINFLQKGARLNVSGLLKCSFHRGEAEKRDERGGDPGAGGGKKEEEEEREERGQGAILSVPLHTK